MMRCVAMPGSESKRPFVGRRAERALLRQLLRQAGMAQPSMAVIAGPAGAGKTALLRWLSTEATAGGAYLLHASASGTTLPFATVRRLFAPLPDIARAIPGPEMAVAAADALVARARRRLLVVLLDDVQDLEPESRVVLDEVLTALDDAGTRHGLHLVVALTTRVPLPRDGLADRLLRLDTSYSLTLGGLDDHEVFELLALRGHRPDPVLVRQLIDDTGGLPLLVDSEVTSWRAPGDRAPGGRASSTTEQRPPRVRTLTEAIERRLDQVGTATRDLLQYAALLGEPWQLEDLALVAEVPPATVEPLVEAAARAQLVQREGHGMRFAHPLVRSTLLDQLTGERRRSMHRTIAERFGLDVAREGDGELSEERLLQVVDHLLRGQPGDPLDTVAEMTERAGRVAMSWGAWHEAARFLSASAEALAALHPYAETGDITEQAEQAGVAEQVEQAEQAEHADVAELARRYLDAGHAAYLDLDRERCEQLLGQALTWASQVGDGRTRLTAAMFLARQRGGMGFQVGQRVDLTELEDALDTVHDAGVPLLVEARATLAEVLIISGATDRALAIIESAREVARGSPTGGLEAPLGRTDFAEGIHRLAQLELEPAIACLERGQVHAVASHDRLTEVYTRSRRALACLMAGEITRAQAALAEVEKLAVAQGFWGEVGLAAAQRAFADTLAGDPDAAGRVEQAYSSWRRTGFTYIAVLLAPAVHALAARTRGLDRESSRPALPFVQQADLQADLQTTTALAALAAVDAHDAPAARVHLNSARWRTGFRGPVTQNNGGVAVALVEVGDLLDDHDLVRSARVALEDMYERGVMVVLGWPALVPRLLAVVARHEGDVSGARRFLDHALALADRERLDVERARVFLERARVDAAAGVPAADVAAGVIAAARIFDHQAMHGWVARCDELAQALGLSIEGVEGTNRERTIFTNDVVGSTAANARLGDALYLDQLRIHDRLVRARLREFRGLEIKHTGDGLNAVFDDPNDAVRCALTALDDIRRWQLDEPDLALQIRCGLARGRLIPSGGDFFGLVQSQAARVCSLAAPGELLTTVQVVDGLDAAEVSAESMGQTALRGFPDQVEVFRVFAS